MYFKSIDVLRFIAVFVSFLTHIGYIDFYHGHTFFFVLSGFLLTTLAQREVIQTGGFSLYNYTIRRIIRIFPLYFLILTLCFFVIPYFLSGNYTLPNFWYYLTFTANYYNEPHIFALQILWAVSVQEQFYLFISFCFKFFYKHLKKIGLGMIALSFPYKYLCELMDWNAYFHTVTHFSSFGIGILLAISHDKKWFQPFIQLSKKKIFIVYLLIIGIFIINIFLYKYQIWYYIDNLIISLAFAFIIAEQCFFKNLIIPLIRLKRLQYLGRISYGLYCYQGIVISIGILVYRKLGYVHDIWFALISFIVLVVVTHISYTYFEKHFLQLKNKFRKYKSNDRYAR